MSQPKCSATSTTTGERCGNLASMGTTVCYKHGARAPQVRKAAQRRIEEAKVVSKFLKDYPIHAIDDPIVALQSLTSEAQAFYLFVSQHVANIDVDQWAGEEGKLSAYVALLERAQAQAQRFLSDWVRLGLEERLVRLSERQAEAIGRVIDGVLNSLGMDEETLAKARGELPRQLRLVSRAS